MKYSKGQILTLDLGNGAHDYLVLKSNGDIVELFCLYDVCECKFGSSQNYFNSTIDIILENRFYKRLSQEVQKAIIPQKITQYSYDYNSNSIDNSHMSFANYSTKQAMYRDVRKIYLLDLEDIEIYFNYTYTRRQLNDLFPSGDGYWLRSARSNRSEICWYVYGNNGYVDINHCSCSYAARPAFTIDLSKVSNELSSINQEQTDFTELQEELFEEYPWLTDTMLKDLNECIMLYLEDAFTIDELISELPEDLNDGIKKNIGAVKSQDSKEFIAILVVSLDIYKVYKISYIDRILQSPPYIVFGITERSIEEKLEELWPDTEIKGEFIDL